ncbi:MAG: sigma-54 dependent transcriptional regulator [Polyangia bacterium]
MANPIPALAVDDDPEMRRAVCRMLEKMGYAPTQASSATEAVARLADRQYEVVVTDLKMPPGPDGLEVVRAVRKLQPTAAAIVLTGNGSVADCVAAMRAGANDFVTKPFHPDALAEVIRLAVDNMRIPRAPGAPKVEGRVRQRTAAPAATLLGNSPAILELLALIERVAPTPATVLITGETGTGKEVVARLLHGASPRSSGPFVAVNCGAVPENLIESELFGHARGAFTGAVERRQGRFAQADGGTLFLDEVGELPLHMQVRLLRVLQTREVVAVGEAKPQHVDIRVVAATNRDLPAMVASGAFREDLFYRLNVVHLELPPLRVRKDDISALFRTFVDRSAALLGRSVDIAPEVSSALSQYRWPGNVRELENLAERMVILDRTGVLSLDQLPRELKAAQAQLAAAEIPPAEIPSIAETGLDLEQTLEQTEWRLIDEALRRADGNKAQAARLLGINRTTLVEKLKRRQAAT